MQFKATEEGPNSKKKKTEFGFYMFERFMCRSPSKFLSHIFFNVGFR
jgi:hypothetical protein